MAKALLLLCLICVGCISMQAVSSHRPQVISGRIIAYESGLACMNGNWYWSMLIHVQDHGEAKAKFVRVYFSVPCSESPKWLRSATSSIQKFRLIRDKHLDRALEEFLGCTILSKDEEKPEDGDPRCPPTPIWKYLPGGEQEKLPFGQKVRGYRSMDLPLEPVV
ncbi:MAG TPA: hypothetical protein VI636_03715 [Candidatus Angelobacter sp.]